MVDMVGPLRAAGVVDMGWGIIQGIDSWMRERKSRGAVSIFLFFVLFFSFSFASFGRFLIHLFSVVITYDDPESLTTTNLVKRTGHFVAREMPCICRNLFVSVQCVQCIDYKFHETPKWHIRT